MTLNGREISKDDAEAMILLLQGMLVFKIGSYEAKELLFVLRQGLLMSGLQAGGKLQVEDLQAILAEVTFDVKHLRLWK